MTKRGKTPPRGTRDRALGRGLEALLKSRPDITGSFAGASLRKLEADLQIARQRAAMEMARDMLGIGPGESVPAADRPAFLDLADQLVDRITRRLDAAAPLDAEADPD